MLLSLIMATQTPAAKPFMLYPDIHGDQIVFTSEGDLWLGSLTSGEARRMTTDPGVERNAQFSPDGKTIAFEGEYDGQRQVYVIPTEGGTPRRLTNVEAFRAVTGWTPDGSQVVFRMSTMPTNYAYATVPAKGGGYSLLPMEFASHVAFLPGKDRYTFTRFNRWYSAWFRYIGGMANQIWVHEPGAPGKEFRQITNLPGTNEFPWPCEKRIYFANENQAKFSLMSVPEGGGTAKTEFTSNFEIRELSGDGSRIVFQNGMDVDVFDPATGKVTKVDMNLRSDLIHMREFSVPVDKSIQSTSISPSGKRVLAEARGQIVSLPVGEGEARVLKATNGVRYRYPAMSKDAKKLAYIDDSTGQNQVYVAQADGSSPRQLTHDTVGQLYSPTFSPDGQWIAFTDSECHIRIVNVDSGKEQVVAKIISQWFGAQYDFSPDSKWITFESPTAITKLPTVNLYEIATGKTTQVSDGRAADSAPVFSRDGKYLVFVSNRRLHVENDFYQNQLNLTPTGMICLIPLTAEGDDPLAPKDSDEAAPAAPKADAAPSPMKVDLDGMFERRVELPVPPAAITSLAMPSSRVIYVADGAIKFYDLATKSGGDLGPGAAFTLSADGKSLLVNGTSVLGVGGEPKKSVVMGGLRLSIDPASEWKQIYWDSWRLLRDYFYLSNMHGTNWDALGKKYAALLPSVRSREELSEIIRWLQAEIGSSHEYLQGGDIQDLKTRLPGAYIGAVLEPSNGSYKIAKIYRGDGYLTSERSPLLGAGKDIREGMYLVAIGGEKLRADRDPYENLAGRAGQTVSVTVNSTPSLEGAKTYFIKPVASETRMRYLSWVEANRAYVAKHSGGKLGYLHLAAMTNQDMEDFIRQYFYQRDKEGFVIDGRFNNGGYVQDFISRVLNEKLTGFFNQRNNDDPWTRQGDYFAGPMALLINEFDISCGEEFPHRFKDLKLGPLIGRRTMGGEVGSSPGWPLVDGGVINVPNYGMFTPDGKWAIEGRGVSPDIDVPSDPNAYVAGRDPQIDKAIEYLLGEISKKPTVHPKEPPARDRVKNPG